MAKLCNLTLGVMVFVLTAGLACGPTNIGTADTAALTPTGPESDGSTTRTDCVAQVVEQSYENGFMFWIGRSSLEKCATEHSFDSGTGEIWVAYVNSSLPSGNWQVFIDDWTAGKDPETDFTLTAPAGLLQPIRGFGKVWRTRLSEAERKALGWATGTEFLITSDYSYEGEVFVNNQGDVINRPGKHKLTGLAGDTFIFDEVSQTVQYSAPPSP